MEKAFITLLSTKNYLSAVLVLKKSMEAVHTRYPLVCGVTEDICDMNIIQTLNKNNIIIEKIKRLQYHKDIQEKWPSHSVLNTASKLSLFTLKSYDKLCYIDADTFLLQNIDNVFDRLDGSMIEPGPGEKDDASGFSSLFVFQPKYHNYEYYISIMENIPCVDGNLLGNLWFFTRTSPCHRIPYSYCTHYTYAVSKQLFPDEADDKSVFPKVIHFCNENKPWLNPEKFPKTNPIIKKYFEYLDSVNYSARLEKFNIKPDFIGL